MSYHRRRPTHAEKAWPWRSFAPSRRPLTRVHAGRSSRRSATPSAARATTTTAAVAMASTAAMSASSSPPRPSWTRWRARDPARRRLGIGNGKPRSRLSQPVGRCARACPALNGLWKDPKNFSRVLPEGLRAGHARATSVSIYRPRRNPPLPPPGRGRLMPARWRRSDTSNARAAGSGRPFAAQDGALGRRGARNVRGLQSDAARVDQARASGQMAAAGADVSAPEAGLWVSAYQSLIAGVPAVGRRPG